MTWRRLVDKTAANITSLAPIQPNLGLIYCMRPQFDDDPAHTTERGVYLATCDAEAGTLSRRRGLLSKAVVVRGDDCQDG
jgi:hypothetical protein